MRVRRIQNEGRDPTEQLQFADWLRNDMCIEATSDYLQNIRMFIQATFPDFQQNFGDHTYLLDRVILAPKNSTVDDINNQLLNMLPGDVSELRSIDSIIDEERRGLDAVYPVEFLNTLTPSGMPPHNLRLKVGMPIILLRNLSPDMGLCNGVRMVLLCVGQRVLTCKIVVGAFAGQIVHIPRMSLIPSDTAYPFQFRRRQFPIKPAFALTINKSQGQTVGFVGFFLYTPVFSHGQLYVALSRVTARDRIKVLAPYDQQLQAFTTRNVVYREVLSRI